MNASVESFVELVPGGPVHATIRPPGSKSLTNRALVCAAFAEGTSELEGLLDSEDTRVMLDALKSVGVRVDVDFGQERAVIEGLGARAEVYRDPSADLAARPEQELFIANSGTTIRFLTAALSALGGKYLLHGVPRMHERPIGDLVTALQQLGDPVLALSANGCPPVRINSRGWNAAQVEVAGNVSSQYLSGLLMAAPLCKQTVEIRVVGELVSRPYVDMTISLMADFGVEVEEPEPACFRIPAQARYHGRHYLIEPDASAASYHWAAAAITGGAVTVEGLCRNALQGDVGFVEVLREMGCTVEYKANAIRVSGRASRGVDVDMNAISDCVQTLSVVALFAEGTTTVRGVGHNRFKETDRIGDLARELRKLGADVQEHEDGMTITPGALQGALLETYHDHRMAMSLALAGLKIPGVQIKDPACTGKTYPHYFADLEKMLGRSHLWHSNRSD